MRNLVALMLPVIVALAILQTQATAPSLVSADNSISVNLLRAPTSTEPATATGFVQVNQQSGKLTVQIHQASPNSNYSALFVSAGANMQLGTFESENGGEANLQITLKPGTYVGIFQILRNGVAQFMRARPSFTI